MKATLTIQEKLKDLRVERELTLEQLAQKTKLSKSALGSYESDENKDISHYAVRVLAQFYCVSADYLLGLTDNKNHSNTELAALHLSDDMVELLKSGRINTRLLCEIAAHEGFVKLLADIEIYVDRIASMQIQNLNAWVDVARNEIMAKYNPGEDDPHIRMMDAAKIKEDEYFQQAIHDDIDSIIKDIREAHKDDSDTAPAEDTAISQLKEGLEAAANFEGSPQEKRLVGFCKELGIDYRKLTPEEFYTMMQVLNKSKHMRSHIKQRGKKRK